MAFNENTVQRIREFFQQKNVDFYEKKMFSGVCFMVDEKMCCGTHIDKNTNEDFLLCRIGDDAYANAIEKENKRKNTYFRFEISWLTLLFRILHICNCRNNSLEFEKIIKRVITPVSKKYHSKFSYFMLKTFSDRKCSEIWVLSSLKKT